MDTQLVIHEEEYKDINEELKKLHDQTPSKLVFLVDKEGSQIASVGDSSLFDTASFASLAVSNVIAAKNIADFLGQKEFTLLAQEGEIDSVYISLILDRIILVVIFTNYTYLSLVRLWVKNASANFAEIFQRIFDRTRKEVESIEEPSVVDEVTEEDINHLFQKIFKL